MTTFEEEYDITWTKEYGKDVDKIIALLEKEYSLYFRQQNLFNTKFNTIMIIIHAINYARHIGLDKSKVKNAIEKCEKNYRDDEDGKTKGSGYIDKNKLLKELGI